MSGSFTVDCSGSKNLILSFSELVPGVLRPLLYKLSVTFKIGKFLYIYRKRVEIKNDMGYLLNLSKTAPIYILAHVR